MESDVILNRDALWQIAQRAPRTLGELRAIPELGQQRLAKYGEEILRVVMNAHVKKANDEN